MAGRTGGRGSPDDQQLHVAGVAVAELNRLGAGGLGGGLLVLGQHQVHQLVAVGLDQAHALGSHSLTAAASGSGGRRARVGWLRVCLWVFACPGASFEQPDR